MPVLEIRRRTGAIETRALSKQAPLMVGQLPTNDIHVDADGVAPVHCRISWNRRQYEVASVSPEGVQFNGSTVSFSPLASGDVIRVGDVDIVMLEDQRDDGEHGLSPQPDEAQPLDSHAKLRPITEDELPVRSFRFQDPAAAASAAPEDAMSPAPPDSRPNPPVESRVGMHRVAHVELDFANLARQESHAAPADAEHSATAAARIKQSLAGPRVRPGEQDPLRSPLVIGLAVGAFLLLVSAASIWFVLSRERAQKQYQLAESQLRTGQFAEAIAGFEQFLRDYPSHKLAPQARAEIGTAQVEQAIAGATPAWDKGLEAIQKYVDANRSNPQFEDPASPLRKFVAESTDRIASGALDSAKSQRKRELLAVSDEAVKLLVLYSPAVQERLEELRRAARAAELVVQRQETFDATVAKMDEALSERKPAWAFQEYRHVLAMHPLEGKEYRPFRERMKKSLELERTLTVREEGARGVADRGAAPDEPPGRLILARRIRVRSDVPSVGAAVYVTAGDCLYGVDSTTGEPLWRKVVGLDPPFAPVSVLAGQPALLVASSRHRELWLLATRTGEVLWKLDLTEQPAGAPLVHEGQIYLATRDSTLEQIDLQTGRATARIKFAQPISAPAAVSLSGERLYVPGNENVLYVLTRRPLACEQVVWLGHGPASIQAPALMLRAYLLLAENFSHEEARLRLFDTSREDQAPQEIAQQKLTGQVRDALELRGKTLFVPSSPERVWAYTVAETGDQKSLTAVASFQVKDARGAPIYLLAGPDDQMWMCSSSLRRFELGPDSLLPDKQEVAVGVASQPLQSAGDSLFVARRLPHSRGVLFAEVERRQMIVQWQISLGAGILAAGAPAAKDAAVLCVTTLGDLFQVTPQRLARGGYDMQPVGQLPIPEGLAVSLSAVRLEDGRLAAYCGGAEPRLWLPGNDGQPREQNLPGPLQAAPVRLGGGLLLALPGRLRLTGRPGGEAPVEDLPAPISKDDPPRWKSVAALSDTQAVVLSEAGRLVRVQFGTAPVPHLEEITHWDAGRPVDVPFALDGGRLFVIDDTPRLVMLDAASLEPQAASPLEAAPAAAPRPAGTLVFVELKSGVLSALDTGNRLEKRWQFPLQGAWLSGDPVRDGDRFVVALTDGRIVWLDAQSGAPAKTLDLGQQLGFGPQRWGDNLVVGTIEGSLVVIDRAAAPAAAEVNPSDEN
ncbi:MAG: PQQ-binding-like beta-propeller repeat protein [Planctomycetia bacterium]|nr:PQQ-binding-like beta-propeller repeat protein [Planctomycetia bacterium]